MDKLKLLLLAFTCLVVQACKHDVNTHTVLIDSANAYKPVIKVTGVNKTTDLNYKFYSSEASNNDAEVLSIACNSYLSNDTLIIEPKFSLADNDKYLFEFSYANSDTKRAVYKTPKPNFKQDREVARVYPTNNTIPANILMFHVLFNAEMDEDPQAFKHVKLLDENNREKQMVWREKSNWTQHGKHLVLMIHPGRIKRGIRYMNDSGQLFEPGKTYTLLITTKLKDSRGVKMAKEYRKRFTVAEEDRTIPKTFLGKAETPKANSKDALKLPFSEEMDYGAMQIGLTVSYKDSLKVEGRVTTDNGIDWYFLPDENWKKGNYTITLNDYVVDLGSNHLNRYFEEKNKAEMKNREEYSHSFTIE